MKINYNAEKRFSAILAALALTIVPITYGVKPTSSALTLETTENVTINLKSWLIDANVSPGLLDGNCATVFITRSATAYKNVTFQYSRYANMASPLARTMTIQDPTQENRIELTKLDGNATYYYRIRADDAYRVDWSDVKSFTTTSAIAPGQYFNCD